MSPMVRRSLTVEFSLLGFLHQGPLHGYQIHQRFEEPAGLGRIWRVKQARLYALLGRLEEDGYIRGTLQQQEARPARRVFELTKAGEEAFLEWVSSPVQAPRQIRQEFQAKLFFARLDEGLYLDLIAKQRIACRRWLEDHKSQTPEEGISHHSYAWLVDQYRIGHIQAMLDWLDICQEMVQGSVPDLAEYETGRQ